MNKTMYGIRRKGESDILKYNHGLVKNDYGCHSGLYTLIENNCHVGCGEWLVDDVDIAVDALNNDSGYNKGAYYNPDHNLNPDDYEIVKLETVISVV